MKRQIWIWIALLCILMNTTVSATSFSFVTNGPIDTIIPDTGSSGGELVPLPGSGIFEKPETTGKTDREKESDVLLLTTDRFVYAGDKKEYISVYGSLPEGCRIVFACYTGSQISHISGSVFSKDYAVWFPVPEEYDSIKVMIWDELGNCIPITGAKIYK